MVTLNPGWRRQTTVVAGTATPAREIHKRAGGVLLCCDQCCHLGEDGDCVGVKVAVFVEGSPYA